MSTEERSQAAKGRNISGWNIFHQEIVKQTKKGDSNANVAKVTKCASEMWKAFSEEEKYAYNQRALKCKQHAVARQPETIRKKKVPVSQVSFRTKCSLGMVIRTMNDIRDDERKCSMIKDMGFESILSMKCTVIPREFIMGLISLFEPRTCTFRIDACKPIPTTVKDVGRVFGILSGGKKLPNDVADDNFNIIAKLQNISFKDLTTAIIFEEASIEFWFIVVAFFLASFLCPTTKDACSMRLLAPISVTEHAKEYNWGKFVLKWLVEEVMKFKCVMAKGKTKRQSMGIGGCIVFLMLFYFDKVPRGAIPIGRKGCVLSRWTNKDIAKRIAEEKKAKEDLVHWIRLMEYALSNVKKVTIASNLIALDELNDSIVTEKLDEERDVGGQGQKYGEEVGEEGDDEEEEDDEGEEKGEQILEKGRWRRNNRRIWRGRGRIIRKERREHARG